MKYRNKMKLRGFFFLMIFPLLFSCQKQPTVSFQNPIEKERTDEVIILSRNDLAGEMEWEQGLIPVFYSGERTPVASQVDDLNQDGEWDEVVLVMDFESGETRELTVEFVKREDYPGFEKRTNLRLGIEQADGTFEEVDHYEALPCDDGFEIIAQGESVNWENDKIGFRNYFDCRNVKDLFGKREPQMIIDKIHTPELGSYHELADWGMDVLHCGSSLGAGG